MLHTHPGQSVQEVAPAADCLHKGQGLQACPGDAAKLPAVHWVHELFVHPHPAGHESEQAVPRPVEVEYKGAAQSVQEVAPVAVEYVPMGHVVHWVRPANAAKVPGEHDVHELLPAAVLIDPAGHCLHENEPASA